jgi:hypothetical protein
VSAAVTRLDDYREPPKILGALQLVRRYSRARGSARAVLIVLASYADRDGTGARPGTDTIARDAGVSVDTVKRARRKLVELGEIEILEHGTGARATRYRITISTPGDKPVDNRPNSNEQGVQSATPGGLQTDTPGGLQTAPRPSIDRPETGEVDVGPRCSRHRGVEEPPPCRGCGRARERADLDQLEQRRATREQRRLAALEKLRADQERADAQRSDPETRAELARAVRNEVSRNRTRSGTLPTDDTKGRDHARTD